MHKTNQTVIYNKVFVVEVTIDDRQWLNIIVTHMVTKKVYSIVGLGAVGVNWKNVFDDIVSMKFSVTLNSREVN